MFESQQDAMAYVRKFGRPDLFKKVTTNTKWPEISESLTPKQEPHNRQDLLVRVVPVKNQNLLKILKDGCFGCLEAPVLNFKNKVYRMQYFFWLSRDAKFYPCNYVYHFICVHCPKAQALSLF